MAYGNPIYKRNGGLATGTSGCSPAYPIVYKRDLLILCVVHKSSVSGSWYTVSTPSGWTAPSNNTLSAGRGTQGSADAGPVVTTMFYKIATGSESGSITLSWSGTITSCQAVILAVTKPPDSEWETPVCVAGYDVTPEDNLWTTSGNTTGTKTIVVNDLVVACTGVNSDGYTFGSETPVQSGIIFSGLEELFDTGTSNGTDQRIVITTHKANSGTSSSSTLTYTATTSGYSTTAPAGVTIQMVLRVTPWGKELKRYTGSAWKWSALRLYTGSAWEGIYNGAWNGSAYSKILKRYTGSAWSPVSVCTIDIDKTTINLNYAGDAVPLTITCGNEVTLSASKSWIYWGGKNLHYREVYSITAAAQAAGEPSRSGYLYLSIDGTVVKTITINQEAGPTPAASLDYTYLVFDNNGSPCTSSYLELTSNCSWYIDTSIFPSWLYVNISSGSSGVSNIIITVASGSAQDSGWIIFYASIDHSYLCACEVIVQWLC